MQFIQKVAFTFEEGKEAKSSELSPIKAVAESIADELLPIGKQTKEEAAARSKELSIPVSVTVWEERTEKAKIAQDRKNKKPGVPEAKSADKSGAKKIQEK